MRWWRQKDENFVQLKFTGQKAYSVAWGAEQSFVEKIAAVSHCTEGWLSEIFTVKAGSDPVLSL